MSSSAREVVARWRSDPGVAAQLVDVRELPGRSGRTVEIPSTLHPRLVAGLWDRGVTRLFSHQADALAATDAGLDLVVATPTASGKSLCYHLPVLDALLRDPTARALYLFPTKALARDQVEAVRELVQACRAPELGVAVIDGDTPPDQRRRARQARIVATNPDMLHAGLLPHHASWAGFLAGLRHVVVDELHVYRGVFGAHVANVVRRLRRLAAFHDAAPRFVATSATIANPGELATQVLGSDPARLRVLTESGAPAAPRTFVLYNPPVVDEALGLRGSYVAATTRVVRDLLDARVSTLVFARSRRTVEVLVRTLRDELQAEGDDDVADGVRGYRGGYLPDRRRDVEARLRRGETRCVVATSALELGIDVGGLDAVVLAGWPGSRAAAWQRAGRAGRRGAHALVVLVATSAPLDQYVAADPEFLFGEPPEHGRVDPDNLAVLVPHLKCAAFELSFGPGERFGALDDGETTEVLRHLAGAGLVYEDGGRFHWIADAYPAQAVPLRGPPDENFTVVELDPGAGAPPPGALASPTAPRPPGGRVIAEVDHRDAPRQLHPNAIYALEGRLHEVVRLDWGGRKAWVRAVDVDYTTEAMTSTDVRVLEELRRDGAAGHGDVHVVDQVIGFKKIKLHTGENVGYGDVALPPLEMHTRALWLDAPAPAPPASHLASWSAHVTAGVAAAARALKHVAALIVLCDGGDVSWCLGEAEPGHLPRIYLYDACPGGAGLTERLYDERRRLLARALRLVTACACARGCPACVGPQVADRATSPKDGAGTVLEALVASVGAAGREAAA